MTDKSWIGPDLYGDIERKIAEHQIDTASGGVKWSLIDILILSATLLVCLLGILYVDDFIFDFTTYEVTYMLGALGLWRYGWWFNHALRARRFECTKFPVSSAKRNKLWRSGWRPGHIHVQMTTFNEEEAITRHVMEALFSEIRATGIPTTIYVGTGSRFDEDIISDVAHDLASDLDVQVVFVRQDQPGKRMAIGIVMRAIIRTAPEPDDLIVFMDGDAVLGPSTFERCSAMFGIDPELEALTTDEHAITFGPGWMRRWLDMRFAQRRLAMQSHAMSDKVLTLTGRMSMFRARQIINRDFVRTIEADHLDHWLWGRFRFLSGDDKSTWYYLLSRGAKMTYVPDVCVYTVEVIKGDGKLRMVQNLRRWSGNMLRNGARALQLGPRLVGPFIWWCVLDQRIAIWTMLVSPALIFLSLLYDPRFIIVALLWIVLSRLFLCLFLFRFAKRADMTWPFLLYINQLLNACVKSFMLFFPHKQSWNNRGGQKAGYEKSTTYALKNGFAVFQFVTTVLAFLSTVGYLTGRTSSYGFF